MIHGQGAQAAHSRRRPARRDVLLRLLRAALLLSAATCAGLTAPAHAGRPPAPLLALDPSGHASLDGLSLTSARHPDHGVPPASRCPHAVPVRAYDISAEAVDITLNRYGDHDPLGRAYVLTEQLPAVRAQEQAAAQARAGSGPVPVTAGLQGDAIQPLTLRVRPGECLRVVLHDQLLTEPASFHLHGLPLLVSATGRPATETEPSAVARPGGTVTYEWLVSAHEPEGTHYAHSHGGNDTVARTQTEHGLYAAVVVEPAGAHWLDPRTGHPLITGWDAVVVRADGTTFREFTLFYAEDGDEPYQPLDRHGSFVPLVDDLTGAYKPDGRWVNYRSEPFLNRLDLSREVTGRYDESTAYSSYAFGDPATPLMRSYVGDPVVQRVLHAGSEVLHVHHVHGGSIRWRRQPGEGPTGASAGLTKRPPLLPGPSERTDSQSLAPSEAFDQWAECGSGGCQQSVGDFLWHCHVAHHYFAGMWGLWRVYGTVQDGPASTDTLPPLPALPDRRSATRPAVTASHLLGKRLDLAGRQTLVTPKVLTAWLARVLPPPGVPTGYDAGVWDWKRQGTDVLGEPEDSRSWPGYSSPHPGERPQVLFDASSGLPAYPLLHPHLGHRPPFAPGHGPAPYLDPTAGPTLPAPGADGPRSVCPTGTTVVLMPITAVQFPVTLSAGVTDPHGELYVPNGALAAERADPAQRVPMVVRARAQRDCLDVTLVSALVDDAETHGLSKADLHIHFVQFDVQGSDGVVAGFNPEQSVRPWRTASVPLATPAPVGATSLQLQGLPLCRAGEDLAVGPERPGGPEIVQVSSVRGRTVLLSRPLAQSHPASEPTTTEFVRYRYYPDAQTGTAYFHDHVDAVSSWRHGLFGALVVEPPDATWTDPTTGRPLAAGSLADITTKGSLGVDEHGSFREAVTLLQDDVRVHQSSHSTGGALGMRASPPLGSPGPPAAVVRAYVGDPIVLRTLVPGTNDVHTLFVEGHHFRGEPWSRSSVPVNAVHVGISERYDVVVPAAGGDARRAGDYVYGDGRTSKLREGVWGVLRVLPSVSAQLRPLEGRPPPPSAGSGSVCPRAAPRVDADVTAATLALPMLDGALGAAFVPTADLPAVRRKPGLVEPLALHVTVGDCLRLLLRNATTAPVRLAASVLAADPSASAVAPGAAAVTELWASPSLGEATAVLRDTAAPLDGPAQGLYGSVSVAAAGSQFDGSRSGRRLGGGAPGAQVTVHPPHGPAYRDLTLFLQDSDGDLGTHQMPYRHQAIGIQAVSYNRAPATPTLLAYPGDPLRLHVIGAVSEQVQGFLLDGHRWPLEPGRRGSSVVAAQAVGAREVLLVEPLGGAGGGAGAGDYTYADSRAPFRDAGMTGLLRVLRARNAALAPLHRTASRTTWGLWLLALILLLLVVLRRTRRSTHVAQPGPHSTGPG